MIGGAFAAAISPVGIDAHIASSQMLPDQPKRLTGQARVSRFFSAGK